MPRDRRRMLLMSGGIPPTNPAYIAKALSYNPIAFWPFVADANDVSGNGYNGTPTAGIVFQNGTGRDGRASAYFNDASWIDVYSAGLAAAFNGDEIVIGGFCKQTAAALTDGDYHDFPILYSATAGNFIFMRFLNGGIESDRDASSVHQAWSPMAAGNFGAGWRHVLFRCSLANNNLATIIDGTALGNFAVSTVWQGPMSVTGMLWGASSGSHSLHRWLGWMQYVGIWPYLNNAQCADLATMV